MDRLKAISQFARLLLSEAADAVQTDELINTPGWVQDVRCYALQTCAMDKKRQCVTETMQLLAKKINSLPIPKGRS